eukprot:TRINITY_DN11733_c0_g1_i1.p3 TRINITY_DN11733_c0_g1~~TRINITY_DN11733_c0_g1_i1.p3  ORF type:complete len:187 (-),score=48.31 TRINITY_DN11733_c0_g1_i1:428-988(-)
MSQGLPQCAADAEELVTLAAQLKAGVDRQDRQYHLRSYKHCFIGEEALTWMEGNLHMGRQDALNRCADLMAMVIISHVCEEHAFKDAHLFYRFNAEDRAYTDVQTMELFNMGVGPIQMMEWGVQHLKRAEQAELLAHEVRWQWCWRYGIGLVLTQVVLLAMGMDWRWAVAACIAHLSCPVWIQGGG